MPSEILKDSNFNLGCSVKVVKLDSENVLITCSKTNPVGFMDLVKRIDSRFKKWDAQFVEEDKQIKEFLKGLFVPQEP